MSKQKIAPYLRAKIDLDAPISPNFKWREWMCKCGECKTQLLHPCFFEKLEELRTECGGFPMTITSGYRCPDHNKAVGGAPKSRHMVGDAADIKVQGNSPEVVAKKAMKVGFRGIKVYRSWTHVDLRPGGTWFVGV